MIYMVGGITLCIVFVCACTALGWLYGEANDDDWPDGWA